MAPENLHSIAGYPESVDLRYYASTFTDKQRTSRLLQKQLELSGLDDHLFRIKRKPRIIPIDTDNEDYKDWRCRNCFKATGNSYTDNYYLNILDTSQLFCLRYSTKVKNFKFLRFILSKNDCSIDVSDTLMKNEELQNFILEWERFEQEKNQNTVKESTSIPMISSVVKAAKQYSYDLSYGFLKFIGIMMYTFSWIFISRLIVSSSEIKTINKASKQNLPLIYLLKTPSRIDWFIVLTSLLFMDLKIPIVFLSQTVSSGLLRWFLKKCGVIFVRPPPADISGSEVNPMIDEAWVLLVEELIRAKNHFILHLDTPSSTTDNRLMAIIADSIRRKAVDDILVSPVIVNKEKNPTKSYLEKYRKRSFYSKLADIFFYRKLNLGLVKVNFFEPFSFKDLIYASAGRSRDVSELTEQDIHSLTPKMTTHINHDFCRIHPIMTTDLMSYLLLKKFRREVRFTELVGETSALIEELKNRRIRMGFTGSPAAVVRHALSKLGPELVTVDKTGEHIVKPNLDMDSILEMEKYACKTMMHFMMDAVVFTSISLIFPKEFESSVRENTVLKFTTTQLYDAAERLRKVLQFEYTFEKFCDTFGIEVKNTLLRLCNDDLVKKEEKLMLDEESRARRFFKHLEADEDDDYDDHDDYDDFDDDEDYAFSDHEYRHRRSPSPPSHIREDEETYLVNLSNEKLFKQMVFYRNILKPSFDAYLSSAMHLKSLSDVQVPVQYYCSKLAKDIVMKLKDGRLKYPETSSLRLLLNSVNLFVEWEVLKRYRVDDIEFIRLSDKYNESNALLEIIEKIRILE